jgi:hypothetical protein
LATTTTTSSVIAVKVKTANWFRWCSQLHATSGINLLELIAVLRQRSACAIFKQQWAMHLRSWRLPGR